MSKVSPKVKKLYYSIGEVSELTGLKAYVLRYWETEFSQLKPPKNRAGNRTYRQKDIDLIKGSFNEALEVNYSVSLFKGSEMVVAKDNDAEVKKEEEHKLLYDALNKFEGQIIR